MHRHPVPNLRIIACFISLFAATANPARSAEVMVDASKVVGEIRPLHGANNGPVDQGGTVDLSAYHHELAIPILRLHDVHWPGADVVDIHTIFPDLAADPSLPENYDFARTDDYLNTIVGNGQRIVFRLGESIEHTERKIHVHPPKDFEKWAAVCLGIIRHYNEGWAGGFRHDIRYWEIWNEPDNRPQMWSGTDEDYFRLYATAARKIKAEFPRLKVGGPSIGNSGEMVGGQLKPSPFLEKFLGVCKKEALPLDFFSWHWYDADSRAFAARARGVRALLDCSGFAKTESHLNEWNYLPDNDWAPILPSGQGRPRQRAYERMGGAEGAAVVASALLLLQDAPIDVANFYTADTNPFGLFSPYGVPKKTYYTFKAFRMLLDTPARLAVSGTEAAVCDAVAGTNAGRSVVTVMLSNVGDEDRQCSLIVRDLPWDGATAVEVLVLDGAHELTPRPADARPAGEVRVPLSFDGPSVCVVRLRAQAAAR